MIRAQRRLHRGVWLGLSILIPLVLATALVARAHRNAMLAPQGHGAAP